MFLFAKKPVNSGVGSLGSSFLRYLIGIAEVPGGASERGEGQAALFAWNTA